MVISSLNSFSQPIVHLRAFTITQTGSTIIRFDPRHDEIYNKILSSVDLVERDRLFREIGDMSFNGYYTAPVAYVANEILVNPKQVREFIFPGGVSGGFSHWEYAKPAQ